MHHNLASRAARRHPRGRACGVREYPGPGGGGGRWAAGRAPPAHAWRTPTRMRGSSLPTTLSRRPPPPTPRTPGGVTPGRRRQRRRTRRRDHPLRGGVPGARGAGGAADRGAAAAPRGAQRPLHASVPALAGGGPRPAARGPGHAPGDGGRGERPGAGGCALRALSGDPAREAAVRAGAPGLGPTLGAPREAAPGAGGSPFPGADARLGRRRSWSNTRGTGCR